METNQSSDFYDTDFQILNGPEFNEQACPS